jgi:thiosulfate reductase cytochrome b subunit
MQFMTNAVDIAGAATPRAELIHPLYVRVTHWINAVAMLVMIGSGWQIYNASPLFAFTFPEGSLGGWLAGGLLWHFAAMWLLIANGLVYVVLGLAGGRFRRRLLPLRPRELLADARAALTGRLRHDELTRYNAVQKLFYLGILVTGVIVVASGFAIWKPVQLAPLTRLFGGFDTARYVHFFAMTAILAFLAIHIVMALLVPKSLRAMIMGK